jgi:hypothetical protein
MPPKMIGVHAPGFGIQDFGVMKLDKIHPVEPVLCHLSFKPFGSKVT